MLVRDVMSSPAITVDRETTVKDCLRLLDQHRVTALPVVDRQLNLVGVVSEVDLLHDTVRPDDRTHLIPRDEVEDQPTRVSEVMTTMPMTIGPDTDVSDAVELMGATAVKSLPVVDLDRVVGVLSRSDIVHTLAREDQTIHAEVDELLRSAGLDCVVDVDAGNVRIEGPDDPHTRKVAEVIAGSVTGVISVQVR